MREESSNRIDATALLGSLGRTAASVITAGVDFWGRLLDISGSRAADAIRASGGSPPGNLDALLEGLRGYIGSLALAAPLAAQSLNRTMGTPAGPRLLFCANPRAPSPKPDDFPDLTELTALTPGGADSPTIWVSQAAAERLAQAVRSADLEGEQHLPSLAMLGKALQDEEIALEQQDILTVSQALDHLKDRFRKQGLSAATPEVKSALDRVMSPAWASLAKLIQNLKRELGSTAFRRLLTAELVDRLAKVMTAGGSACKLSDTLLDALQRAFRGVGIELSDALSVIARERDWVILDHAGDRVFDVTATGSRLDFYGLDEGRTYTVNDRRMILPARVQDAAQGFAVYPVPIDQLQELLDCWPERAFKAWDIGNGRTPMALFVVDYRESDLGSYRELGVACFVAPRKDPLAIGMHLLHLPVTDRFSCDAGLQIWGYPKTVENLDLAYDARSARCALRSREGALLMTLELPRGGTDSSKDVPLYSYTRKRGNPALMHRTIFHRSGQGEMLRLGGQGVVLHITEAGRAHPLCGTLLRFGLPGRRAMHSAWTEHMSGAFEAPSALAPLGKALDARAEAEVD